MMECRYSIKYCVFQLLWYSSHHVWKAFSWLLVVLAQFVPWFSPWQHWQLSRDLDIVMVNGLCPWGNHHLLPLGPLREPLTALGRANIAVIHNADLVSVLWFSFLFSFVYFVALWSTMHVSISYSCSSDAREFALVERYGELEFHVLVLHRCLSKLSQALSLLFEKSTNL